MAYADASILIGTKKLLGIPETDESFDADIMAGINSALMSLIQAGVGTAGFNVTSKDDVWGDFIDEEILVNFGGVETYVYLKTRLVFDPPTNSFTIEGLSKIAEEIEYRLRLQVEVDSYIPPVEEEEEEEV